MPETIRSIARTHAVRVESRAIIVAAGAFLLSGLVGLLVMHGEFLPIWKEWSVGLLAILVGSGVGAVAYGLSARDSWRRARELGTSARSLPRFVWDTTALTFTHVAILAMLGLVLFSTMQSAFTGLKVDTLTGTMTVGLSGAASAYFLYLSAATTTANKMSTLLSIFLTSGVLLSMTTTTDPHWWQANFSILGTTRDFSGFTFNLTLMFTGATITILADYVTNDLAVWMKSLVGHTTLHIRLLKWALVAIGALLAGVGLVPVNQAPLIHNTVATGMVVIFFILMIAVKRLLPGYPQTFFALGYGFLCCIGVAAILFFPIGYYNLTAFELISSALIFSWLVIFVRNTAAVIAAAGSR